MLDISVHKVFENSILNFSRLYFKKRDGFKGLGILRLAWYFVVDTTEAMKNVGKEFYRVLKIYHSIALFSLCIYGSPFLISVIFSVTCHFRPSLRAGSLVWVSRAKELARRIFAGFAGCRFFVAFDRDTLPKQESLFAGYFRPAHAII